MDGSGVDGSGADGSGADERNHVRLRTIAREWARIGVIGFGGPPAHISLLRRLCVDDRGWLSAQEFEDGVAAANLLPGPASTQLAIFCAWRVGGRAGAVLGGVCFIVPGLMVILALAAVFLAARPPLWITGAAKGAGAAVPAVAAAAALSLVPDSWRRAGAPLTRGGDRPEPPAQSRSRMRWVGYAVAGSVTGVLAGPFLVLVMAGCGLAEVAVRTRGLGPRAPGRSAVPLLAVAAPAVGGLLALVWVAFKVGALSYGGGFVIVPLMQHDAVTTYHWMTGAQFLTAVALGQVTPGPVVQTVAVVGYAAAGVGGGLLAAVVAFTPSFGFVLAGAPRFATLRQNARVQAFLAGAGPAVIGAIAGSTVALALELAHLWQVAVLGAAAIWLLGLRRGVVMAIVGAAGCGIIAGLAGAPVT